MSQVWRMGGSLRMPLRCVEPSLMAVLAEDKTNETLISVVESWAATENPFNSTEEILAWVRDRICL